MNKPRIYCIFTGLGKTYFCKNHLGWADIDEEPFVRGGIEPGIMAIACDCYTKYGYKIVTCATPYVLYGLSVVSNKYDIILILPSENMKEEILQRVESRGDTEWAMSLRKKYYDIFYERLNSTFYRKVYAQPGQYAGEIIEQLEQENLD